MQKMGRYEITAELGRGAMGVVYAAMDPLIGRRVAIKTIRLDTLETPANREELTRRLFREAQSAGVLSHPGIVTIYDVGEQENEAYIVMEFVEGRNLEDVLASGVPQHSATFLSILKQSAAALDYAHEKGIVHRDIKPSNIMLCHDGMVKIADFGVAKPAASSSMTQAGLVLGTPSYMSPEQAQGQPVDGRSDQFSLAVIAFRMFTGNLPFQGPTLTALLSKLLLEEPKYEESGLHPYLQTVFKRALSKIPQFRFPSCTDFVRDLEAAYSLSREETSSPATPAPGTEADKSQAAPQPVAEPLVEPLEESMPDTLSTTPPMEIPEAPVSGAESVAPLFPEETVAEKSPGPQAASPEQSTEAPPRKKSSMLAWAAGLIIVALAAAVIFGIMSTRKGNLPEDVAAPAPEKPSTAAGAVETAPQLEESKPESPKEIAQQTGEEAVATQQKTMEPTQPRTRVKVAPKPVQPETAPAPVESGVITWTGTLEKNAILVIAPPTANVGKITGELPGKPVKIEVDPPEVVIRQVPAEINGYKQLMLYSGQKKYRSITIRWTTIP